MLSSSVWDPGCWFPHFLVLVLSETVLVLVLAQTDDDPRYLISFDAIDAETNHLVNSL